MKMNHFYIRGITFKIEYALIIFPASISAVLNPEYSQYDIWKTFIIITVWEKSLYSDSVQGLMLLER